MTTTLVQSRFSYQARDQQGQVVQGFVSALTLADATKALRAEGKYIVDIKPAVAEAIDPAKGGSGPSRRVRQEDVILFTIQLSVMVDAGVPLGDALTALSEQSTTPAFSAVLKSMVGHVQSGKDFSYSLEQHPRIFPKYFVSLVRASEMSGTMGAILRRLADYLVSQRDIVKKVRGALIYPGFMFTMAIGTTIFLLTAVLPRFTAIFAARKAALPMPTQIMITVSDTLLNYWYAWIAGAVICACFTIWFARTPRGQRCFDWLKLNTPIFGGMFHKLYLSRSLQTTATMIQSGVQLMDCLPVVRDASGNCYYAELWDQVRLRIEEGHALSEPLIRSKLIPRSVSQMIQSGEKTGELPAVMGRVASYLDNDLKDAIKTLTQFIEPVMIGITGALIGSVAIAMLLPILTISKVMAQ